MTESVRTKIRKACDLCYRKRIKCDGQTPRCSHCQTYNSQCTHEAARRRKKPPKSRQSQLPKPPSLNDDSPAEIIRSSDSSVPWATEFLDHDLVASFQMELPSESHVRQVVDTYLVNINSIFPLFDPDRLIQTVDQWYNIPMQRSRTSWAVINVVMAITQHCSFGQAGFGRGDLFVDSAQDCLNKAQSVLTEILMGDVELANLQIVLGLVMVFQGTSDIKPAVFLISTAVRLSQVLGIHRNDSTIYRNAASKDALQLKRVFWVTFILDRNIAMRIGQAPVQQDGDIDIELPPKKPDGDAAGFVSTPELNQDGFNLFRAHVELAQIQGFVHGSLFSVRAQQLSPGEREANCQGIRLLLKNWKSRIPATLHPDALPRTQSYLPSIPNYLCALYGTVLTCLGQLCQVNSMDFRWLDQLRYYGRSITAGRCEPSLPPPQPRGWNALLNECRSFMPLFTSIQDKSPAFMWMNICPYASGLVCLSANSILNFDSTDSIEDQDRRLKLEAVDMLGEMLKQTNHKTLTKVLDAFAELDSQFWLMTKV
ncbi:hypothetical protein DM02DRAFT_583926 [Periconia macrospinosa]|uniref:Zn(2)-C6 fungal-type domain-containing protein n=1 Tax=Periconia macrospinosa TaxID=97972 RepID=A0A2V1E5N4_9PLEO|nr:hypothetical protein DM02DRAFT_583926 [Periconia macrospinosa]